MDHLHIKGARVHNLKNIDVTIPRDKLGGYHRPFGVRESRLWRSIQSTPKASVAMWSLFRRMHASFLGQMDKPEVDYIEGLSQPSRLTRKPHPRTLAPPWAR